MEVGDSQTTKSLNRKVHRWLQGSKLHLKVIIMLRVEKKQNPDSIKIYLDVIKPRLVNAPVSGSPEAYRVERDYVLQNVEIYPDKPHSNFAIHYADVLPRDGPRPSPQASLSATIDLALFREKAQQAITNLNAQTGDDSSSGYDTDQDPTPSPPTESEKASTKDKESSVEPNEDSSDENEPDESDNDEPHCARTWKRMLVEIAGCHTASAEFLAPCIIDELHQLSFIKSLCSAASCL